MLRKSQPNFQHDVNKIEAQAKQWFSYKKNVYSEAGIDSYSVKPLLRKIQPKSFFFSYKIEVINFSSI